MPVYRVTCTVSAVCEDDIVAELINSLSGTYGAIQYPDHIEKIRDDEVEE